MAAEPFALARRCTMLSIASSAWTGSTCRWPSPTMSGSGDLVAAIRSLQFVGFNVTMPYKAAMLELCDEVATAAEMAGAVNTVHCVDGNLIGYNTDGRGMLEALERDAGVRSGRQVGRHPRCGRSGRRGVCCAHSGARGPHHAWSTAISPAPRSWSSAWAPTRRASRSRRSPTPRPRRAVRQADLVINATSCGHAARRPVSGSGGVALGRAGGLGHGLRPTPERTALVSCGRGRRCEDTRRARHAGLPRSDRGRHLERGSQERTPREVMLDAARP